MPRYLISVHTAVGEAKQIAGRVHGWRRTNNEAVHPDAAEVLECAVWADDEADARRLLHVALEDSGVQPIAVDVADGTGQRPPDERHAQANVPGQPWLFIDSGMVGIVAALNAAGVNTEASCQGDPEDDYDSVPPKMDNAYVLIADRRQEPLLFRSVRDWAATAGVLDRFHERFLTENPDHHFLPVVRGMCRAASLKVGVKDQNRADHPDATVMLSLSYDSVRRSGPNGALHLSNRVMAGVDAAARHQPAADPSGANGTPFVTYRPAAIPGGVDLDQDMDPSTGYTESGARGVEHAAALAERLSRRGVQVSTSVLPTMDGAARITLTVAFMQRAPLWDALCDLVGGRLIGDEVVTGFFDGCGPFWEILDSPAHVACSLRQTHVPAWWRAATGEDVEATTQLRYEARTTDSAPTFSVELPGHVVVALLEAR